MFWKKITLFQQNFRTVFVRKNQNFFRETRLAEKDAEFAKIIFHQTIWEINQGIKRESSFFANLIDLFFWGKVKKLVHKIANWIFCSGRIQANHRMYQLKALQSEERSDQVTFSNIIGKFMNNFCYLSNAIKLITLIFLILRVLIWNFSFNSEYSKKWNDSLVNIQFFLQKSWTTKPNVD